MGKGTIIYIGGFQLPDKNAAAHRVLNNGLVLKELGYDVIYIGSSVDKRENDNIPYEIEKGFQAWDIVYPLRTTDWIKYLVDINRYVKIIEQYSNVKYIICYNFPSIALSKIMRYGKKNNIKIVSDISEWYGAQGSNILTKAIKGMDSFYRMRILNKKVKHLIVISDYLEKYYGNQSLIKIPPLVSDYATCKNSNHSEAPLKLLFFGNPSIKKDRLDLIITSLYNSGFKEDKVVLNILGVDQEVFLKKNKKLKNILSSMTNVSFLGKVDHSKVGGILMSNDYSIILRKDNRVNNAGFPTKFVESISNCTPVITSNVGEVKSYIENYNCGVLIRHDLEKTLTYLIESNEVKSFESDLFYYKNYIDSFKLIF